jgi:mRNA interferase RelE/StbE
MSYEIKFKSSAWKSFDKLPKDINRRINEAIRELSDNPRSLKAKKLMGYRDFYRIRVGDYRVVYEIQEQVLVVLIIKVDHRRDVYRGL